MWEGQIQLAVKDGSLHFLFDNKGNFYHNCNFEMLMALIRYYHPDLMPNAFASLLSLFNNVQRDLEPILQYRLFFDSLVNKLSWCKVAMPQILTVMLSLWAIHGHISSLVNQFCTHHKSIEDATIKIIVGGCSYHNSFILFKKKGFKPSGPALCQPAAAAAIANSDQKGNIWSNLFDWLQKLYNTKSNKL